MKATKKIVSLLLAILILAGTLSVSAFAEEGIYFNKNDVYVAGTLVSSDSDTYWLVKDGGLTADGASATNYNVMYSPATEAANAKLTFNNAQISKVTDVNGSGVTTFLECDADIDFIGQNTFGGSVAAIYSAGSLNIGGKGSLSFTTDNSAASEAYGIIKPTMEGSINISGDVKLSFVADDIHTFWGIVCESGDITLKDNAQISMKGHGGAFGCTNFSASDNAKLTADISLSYIHAVFILNSFTLSNNASVDIDSSRIAEKTDEIYNKGLYVEGSISLSNSSQLKVKSGENENSYAVLAEKNISVSGKSKIIAESSAADESIAISALGKSSVMTVSDDAEIIAKAGDVINDGDSAAIAAENLILTDNAKITATGGNETNYEDKVSTDLSGKIYGILVQDSMTVSDNVSVTATAGTTVYNAYGLNVKKYLTVSGKAVINARSGKGGYGSAGIIAGSVETNDESKIIAIAGESESVSMGINSVYFKSSGSSVVEASGNKSEASVGIWAEEFTAEGNSKITATAKKTSKYRCLGIAVENNAVLSGNTSITAKAESSGDLSTGFLCQNDMTVSDKAVLNSSSSTSTNMGAGVWCEGVATVSGDVKITATSDNDTDYQNVGFTAEEGLFVSGNATITATGGNAKENSVGILSDAVLVSGSPIITATAKSAEELSIALCYGRIFKPSGGTIEATGETSAFYSMESPDLSAYPTPYVAVNTSATAENATDWDGTTELGGENSTFKYILIAPEKPEEPAEPTFFEKIAEAFRNFFDMIADFFASLFVIFG